MRKQPPARLWVLVDSKGACYDSKAYTTRAKAVNALDAARAIAGAAMRGIKPLPYAPAKV